MECLDANVVQDLLAGALDAVTRTTAIEHLDGCQACRDLIDALTRDATRVVAADTLRDPDKGQPRFAMLETVASGSHAIAPNDALAETAEVSDSITKAVRVRVPDQSGRSLGRYTLVERLGAGATGVVYRAEDRELGRSVALKQLHRPDPALTARLVREARSMAQVNHPNVVAVYDVGVADDTTYIAMELVSGTSLRGWQASTRTVPQVIEVYLAAGRGLAAAHAAGIVHRDFKPDNVLVGSDRRVRVTDFGLASLHPSENRLERSASDSLELTTAGSVVGTPAYMAPEQFLGGNVDSRTDQFNFCVALYEALYGQRPFGGKTFDELGDNVCDGKVRAVPPGSRVSRALRAIVLRGLAARPGDRFPTMDHLLTELGRDRARPWRRTAIVSTALAVLLAVGLGADWAVRDRVSGEIRQSFALTARQTDRAVRLLANRFDAISNQVYSLQVMRDVSGHHDQADFGLGTPEDDAEDLEKIHSQLTSQDWKYAREVAGKEYPSVLAISDYKGRLLFTSAAPEQWRNDLTQLPWIKRALDTGDGNFMTLTRYDEPNLAATKLLGPTPPSGLAVLFTRTLSLGESAKSQFLQVVSAAQLLDDIRLDDKTQLSLVALDGTPEGTVPRAIVARASIGTSELTEDGSSYEVQTLSLANPQVPNGEPIGRLVMARRTGSVLSLFPGARTVFALALILAIGLASGTALRARQITRT
jgi:serine/threonine protein kinase